MIAIARAGIDAASAARALARALADRPLQHVLHGSPVHVIAAGKAAAPMMAAWMATPGMVTRATLAVGTATGFALPKGIEWIEAGHPLPDARSVTAATRALDIARSVPANETLLVLLSGGASALLAHPIDGITLADKQRVVDAMLRGGADIHALNTVRKHISAIKGGRLAAACRGTVITLAISDVVGDDLTVIGSGPAVPDPSTWADAARAFNGYVPASARPTAVTTLLHKGVAGDLEETPKPDDERMRKVEARVIASAADAIEGASAAARELGYQVQVLPARVTGEARHAAGHWWRQVTTAAQGPTPTCVLSAGETTVRVTGRGRGGRNQEFALALVELIASGRGSAVAASVGTDGVDGPTDAAGAIVDSSTLSRATRLGLRVAPYLDDNNSYAFFRQLDDLISTGPTGTNVGDLQVFLYNQSHVP